MSSKRHIGSCVNDIYGHTVNLKKVGPMFFKLTQMQSILILSSFVHPCPYLLTYERFSINSLLSYLGSFSVGIDSATNGRFSNWARYVASFSTEMTASNQHPYSVRRLLILILSDSAQHTRSCVSDATDRLCWCFLSQGNSQRERPARLS